MDTGYCSPLRSEKIGEMAHAGGLMLAEIGVHRDVVLLRIFELVFSPRGFKSQAEGPSWLYEHLKTQRLNSCGALPRYHGPIACALPWAMKRRACRSA